MQVLYLKSESAPADNFFPAGNRNRNRNQHRRAGLAVAFLCAALSLAAHAQSFVVLHSFDGTDGAEPVVPVEGFDANLYGATDFALVNGNYIEQGTAFKITPKDGTFSTIYTFCSQTNCADGYDPQPMLESAGGNFYSTANFGGANGLGTIFRMNPAGSLTTIHNFCNDTNCTDGESPAKVSFQAADGSFYGIAQNGGANGFGTVFRISISGAFTTVYSFCQAASCADGAYPASLILGSDGYLYGVTMQGGAHNAGSVFRMNPFGELTTLYSFCVEAQCADGATPQLLLQASDGNFYGLAEGDLGIGMVFKLTPGGEISTLHTFCSQSNCTDGVQPTSLMQASDGTLYGATFQGGSAKNAGTVFRLTLDGTLTGLHKFNVTDGNGPNGLMQHTNGYFYGTTEFGGASTPYGTVFRLGVGLPAFVTTNPGIARVGARITIVGANLTGATAVSFNGTPATFTLASATSIVATVPSGATTGTVTVSRPQGTLNSNLPFTVLP